MAATFREYDKKYTDFCLKHNAKAECKVFTSPMVDNRYHKEICWDDGAMWCEITELVTESVNIQVHGINVDVDVQLWKTEYWSTESKSEYYYSK